MKLYQILIDFVDFGIPQQCCQYSYSFRKLQVEIVDDIVDMKDICLNNGFELTANERISILHDIIGSNCVDGKAVRIRGLKSQCIRLLLRI